MSNPIKYDSSNNPANLPVLIRGRWWVGTASDFPYYNMSPSIWSSYNTRISPAVFESYVIFIDKPSNGPSMYAPNSTADMIALSNRITGNSAATEGAAINNLLNLTNCFIIDRNYPNITWELLSLFYDVSYIPSYPRVGSAIFDLNQNNAQSNGTLNNSPTFNADTLRSYGKTLAFNGSSAQSISFSTITPGNGNWTVMMIVRFDSFDTSYGTLLTNSSGGPVTSAFGSKAGLISYDYYSGSWNVAYGNTALSAGKWYYLTWVNESTSGGSMTMYVNGDMDSGLFGSITSNGGPVDMIGNNPWAGRQFDGDIGAVYYYKKSLTNEDILRNFFGGPIVASLTQSELYPAFAYDVSIRSTDGYVTGAILSIQDLAFSLSGSRGYFDLVGTAASTTYDFGGVIALLPGRIYSGAGYSWSYNMTMCFWMKYNGSINPGYFFTDESGSASRISSNITGGGIFRFQVTYTGGGGGIGSCSSTTVVTDGTWHHIVCAWSNGSDGINNRAPGLYIYVDGVQEAFTPLPVGNETSLGTLYLGGSGSVLGNSEHDCYIGPFQLYNGVAFNNEQALKNYYAHIFRFKN